MDNQMDWNAMQKTQDFPQVMMQCNDFRYRAAWAAKASRQKEVDILRGGEGSATSALTVRKCENFDPFSIEIWFCDTQNTFYLIVKGLKNAFFMPFLWLSEWAPASCKWSSGGFSLI